MKTSNAIAIALCMAVAVLEGFDIQAMGVAMPRLGPEFGLDADAVQREHHVATKVLVVVHWRHGEVALLRARLVAEVRALVGARVPLPLD